MKKLIVMSALFATAFAFAQEPAAPEAPAPEAPAPEAPAPEAAPAPQCACQEGKPCTCGEGCTCPACKAAKEGAFKKGPKGGEFRHGPQGPRPQLRAKKCNCCPECKGVIILPPDSTEGEPLFKLLGHGPRGGEGAKGPRHGEFRRRPQGRRPQPPAPEAPAPEAPAPVAPAAE